MDETTEQQLKERLEELPSVVRQAIMSSDFEAKIQSIGAKASLHIDQIGIMQDEIILVMIGFAEPSEFPTHLIERLHIDQTKADEITKAVGEQIFLPIRDSMKSFMEKQSVPGTDNTSKPDLSAADAMLSQKTVSTPPIAPVAAPAPAIAPATPAAPAPMAKPDPVKPQNYATDPYREPPV